MDTETGIRWLFALVALAIGLSEAMIALNILTGYEGNVRFSGIYQQMEFAPENQQWRGFDVPFLAHLAVIIAIAAHTFASIPIVAGSVALFRSKSFDTKSTNLITIGLMIAIAFYVVFFVLMGYWLRIRYSDYNTTPNAMALSTFYLCFGLFLNYWRNRDDT